MRQSFTVYLNRSTHTHTDTHTQCRPLKRLKRSKRGYQAKNTHIYSVAWRSPEHDLVSLTQITDRTIGLLRSAISTRFCSPAQAFAVRVRARARTYTALHTRAINIKYQKASSCCTVCALYGMVAREIFDCRQTDRINGLLQHQLTPAVLFLTLSLLLLLLLVSLPSTTSLILRVFHVGCVIVSVCVAPNWTNQIQWGIVDFLFLNRRLMRAVSIRNAHYRPNTSMSSDLSNHSIIRMKYDCWKIYSRFSSAVWPMPMFRPCRMLVTATYFG